MICPIKGVSKDCKDCPEIGWGHCVYWKIYMKRKKGCSKSSPYVPLASNRNKQTEGTKG